MAGLATPPPTGAPLPSRSNSPLLRCPRPPRRPDLLPRVPDRGQGGARPPPEGVGERHGVGERPICARTPTRPSPSPLLTPPPPGSEPPRLRSYPVTPRGSPPVRSAAPATRHPAPGGPAPAASANPRRGRPGACQSGGAGGAEGQLHHPLTPAPDRGGPVAALLPNLHPTSAPTPAGPLRTESRAPRDCPWGLKAPGESQQKPGPQRAALGWESPFGALPLDTDTSGWHP
ncbi:proline-rich protein 2-like [Hippopotamus amphibius kiboko]|uniref:proline-rich protein 2-like n=1 Tax=Hippopotamus amphibius kiboko TaxID=575201 RepID=UPI0025928217|nr:proline-rich protein 2-like [Hippopotamus amphibius kiboko]